MEEPKLTIQILIIAITTLSALSVIQFILYFVIYRYVRTLNDASITRRKQVRTVSHLAKLAYARIKKLEKSLGPLAQMGKRINSKNEAEPESAIESEVIEPKHAGRYTGSDADDPTG